MILGILNVISYWSDKDKIERSFSWTSSIGSPLYRNWKTSTYILT